LYEIGVPMGYPDEFYRPDKWNPEGYYEHLDIKTLNEKLVHGVWGRLAYLSLPSVATISRRAARRADEIRRVAQCYRGMTVKDPRFPLTLQAWRECGAHISGVVVCMREPIQVAYSLRRRNKITKGMGLRLWYEHNRRLCTAVAGVPTWFVSYHNLLEEDAFVVEMGAALAFLDTPLEEQELRRLHNACVQSSMNHSRGATAKYPAAISSLWRELQQRHSSQFTFAESPR
jgi:hypothetical protein